MIVVREAALPDLEKISEIYREAVLNGTGSFETEPVPTSEMAERQRSLVAAGYPFLVAEHDREVVGYAYAGPFRPRAAFRFVVENSVYVEAGVRGSGVGTALLRALVGAAAELGFKQMLAVIGDSQNTASIRLHEAIGFERVGLLPAVGWKMERWLDVVIMQRPLAADPLTRPI